MTILKLEQSLPVCAEVWHYLKVKLQWRTDDRLLVHKSYSSLKEYAKLFNSLPHICSQIAEFALWFLRIKFLFTTWTTISEGRKKVTLKTVDQWKMEKLLIGLCLFVLCMCKLKYSVKPACMLGRAWGILYWRRSGSIFKCLNFSKFQLSLAFNSYGICCVNS